MFKVTISRDEQVGVYYIQNIEDVKNVQGYLMDEYEKDMASVQEELDKLNEKLDTLLANSHCDTLDEYINTMCDEEQIKENLRDEIISEALEDTGYGSIDEMDEKIQELQDAIEEVYWAVDGVR